MSDPNNVLHSNGNDQQSHSTDFFGFLKSINHMLSTVTDHAQQSAFNTISQPKRHSNLTSPTQFIPSHQPSMDSMSEAIPYTLPSIPAPAHPNQSQYPTGVIGLTRHPHSHPQISSVTNILLQLIFSTPRLLEDLKNPSSHFIEISLQVLSAAYGMEPIAAHTSAVINFYGLHQTLQEQILSSLQDQMDPSLGISDILFFFRLIPYFLKTERYLFSCGTLYVHPVLGHRSYGPRGGNLSYLKVNPNLANQELDSRASSVSGGSQPNPIPNGIDIQRVIDRFQGLVKKGQKQSIPISSPGVDVMEWRTHEFDVYQVYPNLPEILFVALEAPRRQSRTKCAPLLFPDSWTLRLEELNVNTPDCLLRPVQYQIRLAIFRCKPQDQPMTASDTYYFAKKLHGSVHRGICDPVVLIQDDVLLDTLISLNDSPQHMKRLFLLVCERM